MKAVQLLSKALVNQDFSSFQILNDSNQVTVLYVDARCQEMEGKLTFHFVEGAGACSRSVYFL